jgi:hypothetical protein
MRWTRWCAHLRPRMNDSDRRIPLMYISLWGIVLLFFIALNILNKKRGNLLWYRLWLGLLGPPKCSSPELGKNSPELGKMTEAMSDSRDWAHHSVELDEGNSRVVSICTGSARFRRKSSPEVRRNLVDAKVRRGFVGARVIETGWG